MKPIEVLMIEDNPGDVLLMEEAVARASVDYRIKVVTDGAAAMRCIEMQHPHGDEPRPDLIILDLKLPMKNGRDVLDVIRSNPDLDCVPIVVVSSSNSEIELTRAMRLPRLSLMTKPNTFRGYVAMAKSIEAFRKTTTDPSAAQP
jgi:CheY-like chemotaxis protein